MSKIDGVIQCTCETCKNSERIQTLLQTMFVVSINSYQSPRVNTGILSELGIFHTRVRVRVNYRLPVPRYPGILTSLICVSSTGSKIPATV